MMRWWHRIRKPLGTRGGFTLVELMLVVAVIGILAAIAMPLYASMQVRARIARVQADARSIASGATMYSAHMASLPPGSDLSWLASVATNTEGVTAGPFMVSIPTPPQGWGAAYSFSVNGESFTVSAAGDGTSVSIP